MPNDEFIPTLTHATERDIDLMLVEELHASSDFLTWIAAQCGVIAAISTWDVKHSKRRTQSRREIDIFFEITHTDGSRTAILIENKLDASEQPDQAESYREELNILDAGFDRASMILVCPQAYASQHAGFARKFDALVTYELIADWFRAQMQEAGADTVLRFDFRAQILDQAIHKHRRGYTPIPEKIVGDFNAKYVALLKDKAPAIKPGPSMLKPANPRESTSMIFDQTATLKALPKDIRPRRFAHELGRGSERRANYVAVTFAGWGKALPTITAELLRDVQELGAVFDAPRPTKTRPNPGLIMSVETRPVDNRGTFEDQITDIEAGIATAVRLRAWLLENEATLQKWKKMVQQTPTPVF